MDTIDALIQTALSEHSDAEDAIRALGLLMEERLARRPTGDDGGLPAIIGPKLASYKLTKKEADKIVSTLTAEVLRKTSVKPALVWALTKSADEKIIPALRHALKQNLDNENAQATAHQALQGLMLFGAKGLPDIRLAAAKGHGEVQESAQDYLDLFG